MSAERKDPRKYVRSQFENMGAVINNRTNYGVQYKLPDGYLLHVPNRVLMPAAKTYVREAREHCTNKQWRPGVKASGHPELDLELVVASDHAKERLRLMQSQRRIDMRDVLYAMKIPEKVLWSPKHATWVWVRGDIAVPVSFTPQGAQVIRTILWASDDLWESNPRPEKK